MKILHVITTLETGGAEKLMVDVLPRLKQAGHEVDLAVLKWRRTPFYEQLEAAGICIIGFSQRESVYSPLHIFRLWRLMRHYDIVHTHNFASQLFAAIASLLCSVVLCTTEHTTSNRRRGWKWYARVDGWMYRRYRRIICISNQAEQNLKEYQPSLTNFCTIFNGVDVAKFHNARPINRLKSPGKFVVIMVAGMRPAKDQETLIRAFSHLDKDKFQLWLVGDGDRRSILEQLVSDLNLQQQVQFLGLRSDIPDLLHTADAVCMSSHYEGLSLSNIEGMSAGKPFIGSDVDGLREVTKGYGILFPHGDDKALAAEIEHLATDPDHYRAVADRCYQRALQFDISKMVDQYNQVYLSITAKE